MKQKELESQQVQTASWIFTNCLLTLQYMFTAGPVLACVSWRFCRAVSLPSPAFIFYYLAHLTKTATLRRLPQFGSDTSPKRGGITMTISPPISPISFRFQVFFAKLLALLSAVSDLKNILEICQKMRNI